jgi:hypothetical protein
MEAIFETRNQLEHQLANLQHALIAANDPTERYRLVMEQDELIGELTDLVEQHGGAFIAATQPYV